MDPNFVSLDPSDLADNAPAATYKPADIQRLVSAAAKKHGVDEDLALRVAGRENGFKPSGTSTKGALGPMQLMPATAKDLGVDPNNVEQNVDGGVRYLGQMLKRYQGDTGKALAAYNFGPGHVDNGDPLPQETVDYVKAITGATGPTKPAVGTGQTVTLDPSAIADDEESAKPSNTVTLDASDLADDAATPPAAGAPIGGRGGVAATPPPTGGRGGRPGETPMRGGTGGGAAGQPSPPGGSVSATLPPFMNDPAGTAWHALTDRVIPEIPIEKGDGSRITVINIGGVPVPLPVAMLKSLTNDVTGMVTPANVALAFGIGELGAFGRFGMALQKTIGGGITVAGGYGALKNAGQAYDAYEAGDLDKAAEHLGAGSADALLAALAARATARKMPGAAADFEEARAVWRKSTPNGPTPGEPPSTPPSGPPPSGPEPPSGPPPEGPGTGGGGGGGQPSGPEPPTTSMETRDIVDPRTGQITRTLVQTSVLDDLINNHQSLLDRVVEEGRLATGETRGQPTPLEQIAAEGRLATGEAPPSVSERPPIAMTEDVARALHGGELPDWWKGGETRPPEPTPESTPAPTTPAESTGDPILDAVYQGQRGVPIETAEPEAVPQPPPPISRSDYASPNATGPRTPEPAPLNEDERKIYDQAVEHVREIGAASPSALQRQFHIGYGAATRILGQMEQDGIIGPADGSQPREVLPITTGTLQPPGTVTLDPETLEPVSEAQPDIEAPSSIDDHTRSEMQRIAGEWHADLQGDNPLNTDQRKALADEGYEIYKSLDARGKEEWQKTVGDAWRAAADAKVKGLKGEPITPETPVWKMAPNQFLEHRRDQALAISDEKEFLRKPLNEWHPEDLQNLSNQQIGAVLKINGLPFSGTKQAMADRIVANARFRDSLQAKTPEQLVAENNVAQLKDMLRFVGAPILGNKLSMARSILGHVDSQRRRGEAALATANHKIAIYQAAKAGADIPDTVFERWNVPRPPAESPKAETTETPKAGKPESQNTGTPEKAPEAKPEKPLTGKAALGQRIKEAEEAYGKLRDLPYTERLAALEEVRKLFEALPKKYNTGRGYSNERDREIAKIDDELEAARFWTNKPRPPAEFEQWREEAAEAKREGYRNGTRIKSLKGVAEAKAAATEGEIPIGTEFHHFGYQMTVLGRDASGQQWLEDAYGRPHRLADLDPRPMWQIPVEDFKRIYAATFGPSKDDRLEDKHAYEVQGEVFRGGNFIPLEVAKDYKDVLPKWEALRALWDANRLLTKFVGRAPNHGSKERQWRNGPLTIDRIEKPTAGQLEEAIQAGESAAAFYAGKKIQSADTSESHALQELQELLKAARKVLPTLPKEAAPSDTAPAEGPEPISHELLESPKRTVYFGVNQGPEGWYYAGWVHTPHGGASIDGKDFPDRASAVHAAAEESRKRLKEVDGSDKPMKQRQLVRQALKWLDSIDKPAAAAKKPGFKPGDRVATLADRSHRLGEPARYGTVVQGDPNHPSAKDLIAVKWDRLPGQSAEAAAIPSWTHPSRIHPITEKEEKEAQRQSESQTPQDTAYEKYVAGNWYSHTSDAASRALGISVPTIRKFEKRYTAERQLENLKAKLPTMSDEDLTGNVQATQDGRATKEEAEAIRAEVKRRAEAPKPHEFTPQEQSDAGAEDRRRGLHEAQADLLRARELAAELAETVDDDEPPEDKMREWDQFLDLAKKYGLWRPFNEARAKQDAGFLPSEEFPAEYRQGHERSQQWDHIKTLIADLPKAIADWRDAMQEEINKIEGGGLFAEQRPAPKAPATGTAPVEPEPPAAEPPNENPTETPEIPTPPAAPTQIAVTGETYPYRTLLRSKGGTWNKDLQAWIFPAAKSDEIAAISKKLIVKPVTPAEVPAAPQMAPPPADLAWQPNAAQHDRDAYTTPGDYYQQTRSELNRKKEYIDGYASRLRHGSRGRGAVYVRRNLARQQDAAKQEYGDLLRRVATNLGQSAADRMQAEVEGRAVPATTPAPKPEEPHNPGALGNYLNSLKPEQKEHAKAYAEYVLGDISIRQHALEGYQRLPEEVRVKLRDLADKQAAWLKTLPSVNSPFNSEFINEVAANSGAPVATVQLAADTLANRGLAQRDATHVKIVPHPAAPGQVDIDSGLHWAVAVTVNGNREIVPDEPIRHGLAMMNALRILFPAKPITQRKPVQHKQYDVEPGEPITGLETPAEEPTIETELENAELPGAAGGESPTGEPAERLPGSAGHGRPGSRGGRSSTHVGGAHGRPRPDAEGSKPGASGSTAERPVRPGAGTDEGDSVSPEREGSAPPRRKSAAPDLSRDYVLTDADHIGEGAFLEKANTNVAAIRILKQCEAEGREATPEEQKTLVKYTGWGASALAKVFEQQAYNVPREYKPIRQALEELLTPEEFQAAAASTVNAHYTAPAVVNGIWEALRHIGMRGGMRMLDPSMGSGNFLGLEPPDLKKGSTRVGIELDRVTAGIAKLLYPGTQIHNAGFERVPLANEFFDVAVSNIPFGNYPVVDPEFRTRPQLTRSIHNYFFAKALDKVREGGVVAFVTSSYTMDTLDPAVREYLSEHADLLGAIRLPESTFRENAGTDVTTDVIFLRKRAPGTPPAGEPWINVAPITVPNRKGYTENATIEVKINEYFVKHPEMMLGKMALTGGRFADTRSLEGTFSPEAMAAAVQNLPEGVLKRRQSKEDEEEQSIPLTALPDPGVVKDGGFVFKDGKCFVREGTSLKPADLGEKALPRVRGMLLVRDAWRNVLIKQEEGTEAEAAGARKLLNEAYNVFTKRHGPLSSRDNVRAFAGDPDAPGLLSLEDYDSKTKLAKKADIFSQTTNVRYVPPETAEDAAAALAITLNEYGGINWKRLGKLTGMDRPALEQSLIESGLVYINPEGEKFETADDYLSGDVRQKLRAAIAAAELDPRYEHNVEALKKVQPADLGPGEIDARLGAGWIPKDVIAQFLKDKLKIGGAQIGHAEAIASWNVKGTSNVGNATNREEFGGYGWTGVDLVELAMNLKAPTVRVEGETKGSTVVDPKATAALREKQQKLKDAFRKWVWEDADRATRLAHIYNERYNNLRLREFDGSHLQFPGMSAGVKLRAHQKNAVWRMLQGGNALLAHVVGAGKTYAMAAAAMEMRRLGTAKKPMFVVPNHLVQQWATEFMALYPTANLFVAGKDTFAKGNRELAMSRIANGNYDAVILSHSSFGKLPVKDETFNGWINEQIQDLENAILEATSAEGEKGPTVKDLQKAKKRLEAKLERRAKREKKDVVIRFEDLGVDQMFVDEAHCFPAGTLVTTELGDLPIEYLVQNRIQARVLSFNPELHLLEWKSVTNWFSNPVTAPLVRVTHESGFVDCTSNHEFWTDEGYVQAKDLRPDHHLQVLQEDATDRGSRRGRQGAAVLLDSVRRGLSEGPAAGRESDSHISNETLHGVRNVLHLPVNGDSQRQSENTLPEGMHADRAESHDDLRVLPTGETDGASRRTEEETALLLLSMQRGVREGPHVPGAGWTFSPDETPASAGRKATSADGIPGGDRAGSTSFQTPPTLLLQGGPCGREIAHGNRGGWGEPQNKEVEVAGPQEDRNTFRSRVVRVAVQERGSDGGPGIGSDLHQRVYCLEVADNHNFFANSVLAKNCFKNLVFLTKMTRIAGIPNSESDRAIDMFLKTQWLTKKRGGAGVVFATGTPISNTMAEMYTVQRYLHNSELREAGLGHFDAWAQQYGEGVASLELAPDGSGYRMNTRFSRFTNLPELATMFRTFADVQTAEMLKLPTPKLKSGKPIIVAAEASDDLKEYVQGLVKRAEQIKGKRVEKGADNMLKITGDGRKAALDMRLVSTHEYVPVPPGQEGTPENPHALEGGTKIEFVDPDSHQTVTGRTMQGYDGGIAGPVRVEIPGQAIDLSIPRSEITKVYKQVRRGANPDGKVAKAVDHIVEIWKRTAKQRSAQLVFSDLSTPKEGRWNVYDDAKRQLIERGIPENEIAFIHDYDTDAKKKALFEAVREGRIRVLFGSTEKMGAGMNVQKKLIALHHLDAPWRPSDIEQREGRILRQGNENEEVEIYRYVTKGSFDAYMWQTLEAKARFIAQIMRGDVGARTAEDVEGAALTYAEIKGIASGNPKVVEKIKVDMEVRRLDGLRSEYQNQLHSMRRELANLPNTAKWDREQLALAEQDLARRNGADDLWRIGGETFEGKEAAARAGARLHEVLKQDLERFQAVEDAKVALEAKYNAEWQTVKDDETLSDYKKKKLKAEIQERHAAEALKLPEYEAKSLGTYKGFDLWPGEHPWNYVDGRRLYGLADISMRGSRRYHGSTNQEGNPNGTLASIRYHLETIDQDIEGIRGNITRNTQQQRDLEDLVNKPFEYDEQLKELEKRQVALNDELDLNKNDTQTEGEEQQEQEVEKAVEPEDDDEGEEADYRTPEVTDPAAPPDLRDYAEKIHNRLREEMNKPEPDPELVDALREKSRKLGVSVWTRGLRFSRMAAPFFSQLERTIEDKMPAKTHCPQVAAIVRNVQNGVKPDELKWSGFDDWLQKQKGVITKEAALEFIRGNQVRLVDVEKNEHDKGETPTLQWRRELPEWAGPEETDERVWIADSAWGGEPYVISGDWERGYSIQGDHLTVYHTLAEAQDAAQNDSDQQDGQTEGTQYKKYTLPGGQNYRELLLTLPSRAIAWKEQSKHLWTAAGGRYEILHISGRPTKPYQVYDTAQETPGRLGPGKTLGYHDTLEEAQDAVDHIAGDDFHSPHWSEANVLAHIRFNDRTGPNGERILHLEEIQSDWHQKGRKHGYKDANKRPTTGLTDEAFLEKYFQPSSYAPEPPPQTKDGRLHTYAVREDTAETEGLLDSGEPIVGYFNSPDEARLAAVAWVHNNRFDAQTDKVPPAPFQKTWHEVAFRRMLRYAAENGYATLTWVTGQQATDRFDLAKEVDSIRYIAKPDGRYDVWAANADGGSVADELDKQNLTPAEIEDFVGKDVAQRIIDGKGEIAEADTGERKLSGVDLKMGGRGMTGFYDKILPAYAAKLGKKWEAKVGTTEIRTGEQGGPAPGLEQRVNNLAADDLLTAAERLDDVGRSFSQFGTLEGADAPVIRAAIREHIFDGGSLEDLGIASHDHYAPHRLGAGGWVILDDHDRRVGAGTYETREQAITAIGQLKSPARTETVHSLPVTPEMRASVLQGQPLFARGASSNTYKFQPAATYRNGVVWLNRHGMAALSNATGTGMIQGVYLDPHNIPTVLGRLDPADADDAAVKQAIEQAAEAHGSAVAVVRAGNSLSNLITTLRHELFHQQQGNAGGYTTGALLLRHPLARKAARSLARRGYDPKDLLEMWNEIGAHLAGGPRDWETMGLTRAQAKVLFQHYVILMDDNTVARLRHIAPQLKEILNGEKAERHIARPGAAGEIDQRGAGAQGRPDEGRLQHGVRQDVSGEAGRVGLRFSRQTVNPRTGEVTLDVELGAPLEQQAEAGRGLVARFLTEDRGEFDAGRVAEVYTSARDDLRKNIHPYALSPEASTAGVSLREHAAQAAQSFAKAEHALNAARSYFAGRPWSENLDFINRIEDPTLGPQATPELQKIGDDMRTMLDEHRIAVQKLGKNKLTQFYQNYFPHLWKRSQQAETVFRAIFGKRPIEGTKGFLKQRKFHSFQEGIDAKLVPVSENPVDLVLLKLKEMERYILAHRFLNEMKDIGLAKYVPALGKTKKNAAPQGWVKIPDQLGTVWGPPFIRIPEAHDQEFIDTLLNLANGLGMKVERVAQLRSAWGRSYKSKDMVRTKFAGPESVILHEIGHLLDWRYNLQDALTAEGKKQRSFYTAGQPWTEIYQRELRNLADLRLTGNDTNYFKKYVRRGEEKMANMVAAYGHCPERFKKVAPHVYAWFDSFVQNHPELRPLADLRYGLRLKVQNTDYPTGGFIQRGFYYMPPGAAQIVSNYLAPGLQQKAWYQVLRGYSNLMLQFALGFSGFHAGFTTMDAAVSKVAIALQYAMSGHPLLAAKHGNPLAVAAAPIANIVKGTKIRDAYLTGASKDPEIAAYVEAIIQGGGRVSMDEQYRTNYRRAFMDAIRKHSAGSAALSFMPMLAELAIWPVLEWLVPRQKLGVFADMVDFELKRLGPNASPEELRLAFAGAWDSVDNRMGQLVYDNLFWDRTVKDLMMLSVQSVGWNLGTIREFGGAAHDVRRFVTGGIGGGIRKITGGGGSGGPGSGSGAPGSRRTPSTRRIAYAIALAIVTGIIGATMTYVNTKGRRRRDGTIDDGMPRTWQDFYFPRTGNVDETGREERMALWGYVKDLVAWYMEPVSSARNKLSPILRLVAETFSNRNFSNERIWNGDDRTLPENLKSELLHLGSFFVPMAVSGMVKERERGASGTWQVSQFAGLRTAPSYIGRTPAVQKMREYNAERRGTGALSDRDRVKSEREISQALRARNYDQAVKLGKSALQDGRITEADLNHVIDRATTDPLSADFKRLDIHQAIRIYGLANKDERKTMLPLLDGKLERALEKMPEAEQQDTIRELQRAGVIK